MVQSSCQNWKKVIDEYHKLLFMKYITHQFRQWEEFEDTKGVIRIRKSKDRQHNGLQKKYKQQSTKHTHKTEDWATWAPVKLIKRYYESLFSQ
jgi:hypothetical protein